MPKPHITLQKSLGRVIRNARAGLGISQESLAELVGLHRTYVGSVERGERNVSLRNLLAISVALGRQLSELIESAEEDVRCQR